MYSEWLIVSVNSPPQKSLQCTMSGFSNIVNTSHVTRYSSYSNVCICSKDTVLSNKPIDDVQYPLRVNVSLKLPQHVVIPDEHAARCRGGAGVGAHLALQGQGEVIGVAKVEITGQINILEHFQVPA